MKIEVVYEVIRSLTLDVPKDVIEKRKFLAIWEEIKKIDSLPTEEGEILAIQDSLTRERIC